MQELLLIVWGWMVAGVTANSHVACVSGREGAGSSRMSCFGLCEGEGEPVVNLYESHNW